MLKNYYYSYYNNIHRIYIFYHNIIKIRCWNRRNILTGITAMDINYNEILKFMSCSQVEASLRFPTVLTLTTHGR